MEKVILFHIKREDIDVLMQLYFTEQGQLFFDGHDIGKTVNDYWGDSDYEYTHTIEPDEVEKLYKIFDLNAGQRIELLNELRKRFSGNDAYTLFGKFLASHDIKYASFSWA